MVTFIQILHDVVNGACEASSATKLWRTSLSGSWYFIMDFSLAVFFS